MRFWSLAYRCNWITAEKLRGAVKTDDYRFGEITPEEYK
ncbi:XkdX family protein [Brevibacillus laterosporus]|uniref:XkdX family protein n=1 Tax=Brevibacillus laterosporus TaxID=1465 RepID=A0A518VD60_BRELA|nr:XkdX family protein [Brevibacillus laterosporus]QDX94936.1 XkdX family protein [Brevibacillus laterosporus]